MASQPSPTWNPTSIVMPDPTSKAPISECWTTPMWSSERTKIAAAAA